MVFRRPSRLRPLSERECYTRLHGGRSGEIEVIRAPKVVDEPPAPPGPTGERPALHLVFRYPRGAGTLTGEQLRRELLRRMESRAGEAA